ncbi:hypothetical protein FIBSPDRAFT_919127 [Athelia psychrophila]|uniref:Ubiquitin-like domain-containing protein n=1 Tax=Athelia psychrophila TaxID=1759441 RepID=A0A166LSI9_9AGAM|nr:hypothetical protein FIBSPDRAFT_919127 [Fibularhizoctonia sp. CBS 109695]
MLSEKAKGKQRAVEFHALSTVPAQAAPSEPPSLGLVIRFTEGIPDLTCNVLEKDSIRDVKTRIKGARPELQDRRLRLIHAGRLLTDGTLLYSWITTLEERQRRATDKGETAESASVGTTWLHCSVGPKIEEGEDGEEGRLQTAQLQPLRGFDRLVAAGFTEADIANFRRQFHSQSASNYLDTDFETEEEFDEHARALEEQWIDSLDNAGTASLSQSTSSNNAAILQGIVVGFFFPLLPFFFVREPKPAVFWESGIEHEGTGSVVLSKRMQMGIVMGFTLNILFGTWTFLLDSA